jgi:hypothetical protein
VCKFIVLKGGETINLAHVARFTPSADANTRIDLFPSDGSKKTIEGPRAVNLFLSGLKDTGSLIHLD